MKRAIVRFVMLVGLVLGGAAIAGPLEDAASADSRGDYATALRLWRELAEQGNAIAQTNLGFMYATGRGAPKDDAEALHWFRKAAEQGNANGQNNLGQLYGQGTGVGKDDAEAVKWFQKAAEQGHAGAQNNLGVMYRDGRGVTRDDTQAAQWFRKAAEQGNATGQSNLGSMYATGRGIAKDDAAAVQWYRKAAEQGNALAQTNLGIMYRDGRGVSPDQAEAVRLFQRAAQQGNANAQEMLASIEKREHEFGDLSRTVAPLVKAYEDALPAQPVVDPARAALTHEIIEASLVHEKWSNGRLGQGMDDPSTSKLPPKLLAAFRATAAASFQPDTVLTSFEHKMAESLDAATLKVGLQWERSDVGRHINRLELEAAKPAQRDAMKEFTRQFVSKGGQVNDARGRACAQVDILANKTEAVLPLLEAFATSGVMASLTQKGQPLDMSQIERAIVGIRPLLREAGRLVELAQCLFELREMSDAEFEQWLEFLRSDAGGSYSRGVSAALRDTLLARAEIFTRVMVEVARQLKERGEA